MNESTFEKIGSSGNCFYGPRTLLLCGFSPPAQPKFEELLERLGIDGLPLIWCTDEDGSETVGRLMQRPAGSRRGLESTLPRAIIAGGILESELHRLMSGCKNSGMRQALWAIVTPFSEKWPLQRLLAELDAERQALASQP